MPLPPVADSVVVYEEPTLPAGRLEVVTTGRGWARTVRVRERAAVWVPEESVAWTAKVLCPAELGVPEITPVVVFSVKPAGRVPDDSAHAVNTPLPPLAARVEL